MSDTTSQLAAVQTAIAALSGGEAANEAGIAVVIASVSTLTDLLGAALARIAALEASEVERAAADLRAALHATA